MSLIARLLGTARDETAELRGLWHRIVELARAREWFAICGVADTLPGRFDTITLVLSLALLRMEREAALASPSVRLTELFVDDMDGQLREAGIGDMVVGKHIGKLMSAMGGRLGAYREALAQSDDTALKAALGRNVTLTEGADLDALAAQVRSVAARFDAADARAVLAGEIA